MCNLYYLYFKFKYPTVYILCNAILSVHPHIELHSTDSEQNVHCVFCVCNTSFGQLVSIVCFAQCNMSSVWFAQTLTLTKSSLHDLSQCIMMQFMKCTLIRCSLWIGTSIKTDISLVCIAQLAQKYYCTHKNKFIACLVH